eukprot:2754190-Pyramimonas_sp.AAC.1
MALHIDLRRGSDPSPDVAAAIPLHFYKQMTLAPKMKMNHCVFRHSQRPGRSDVEAHERLLSPLQKVLEMAGIDGHPGCLQEAGPLIAPQKNISALRPPFPA